MRNFVVDIGNTATKVGIFNHQELNEEYVFFNQGELEDFLRNTSADAAICSSVSKDVSLFNANTGHIPRTFVLTHTLPLPVVNKYATPETLGMDRLAAVCGAKALFPDKACLVIDAGTCITYDIVDSSYHYLGGAISPGLSMRLKAMHQFTSRLPLIEIKGEVPFTGNSTSSCMQSGALYGMQAEIEGIILRYKRDYAGLQVILCGGDTHFFENSLKGYIFAVQNLVTKGLNSILLYNVSR